MKLSEVVDEYKVSTVYTSCALAANAVYGIYVGQDDITDTWVKRDMVITSFYASVVTLVLFMIMNSRIKVVGSLSSFGLWMGRIVCGILMSSFSDAYKGEADSITYWIISGVGVLMSVLSLVGQYVRSRKDDKKDPVSIEPVKLRFMV